MDENCARLKYADGTLSDWMPIDRACFIVAFWFAGKRPEIIEKQPIEKRGDESAAEGE